MTADLIIKGGTVIDGTGAAPRPADVAVKDRKIAAVGALGEVEAGTVLEADGLYVTPGFIDIHSHSDYTLVVDPRAISALRQGVTLEVVGNCGHGCAPVADPERTKGNIYGYREEHGLPWRSVASYLERLEAGEPALNVATLVPNGNLRLAACERLDRPAAPDELRRMTALLEQGLEEGAFGFSTGLEYEPERTCTEQEIAELCRVVARAGGLYATHTRNRPGEAEETVAEALRTSTAAGVRLQISHLQVVARLVPDGRRAVENALKQIEAARAAGLDVAFDMHTRLFGTTNLSAALPPWLVDGDRAEIAERLADPAVRRRLEDYHSIVTALADGDWSRIVLFESLARPELSRRSIAEIGAEAGLGPIDVICEVLLAEIDNLHRTMIVAFCYQEEDLRPAFEHPLCAVGSDATALAPDGPLASTSFHGAYTWAGWFYRQFVRDTGTLAPEEAIRRITSLPASRLGLADRGVVRTGAWADLAVFDPAVFAERGTVFEPNRASVGMVHVLVNGVPALEGGEPTGKRGGRVLRQG